MNNLSMKALTKILTALKHFYMSPDTMQPKGHIEAG